MAQIPSRIDSIGGKLASDYYALRRFVVSANESKYPVLYRLGLVGDLQSFIKCLAFDYGDLEAAFVQRVWKGINEGRIPKERFLGKAYLAKKEKSQGTEEDTDLQAQKEESAPYVPRKVRNASLDIIHTGKRGPRSETTLITMSIKRVFRKLASEYTLLRDWEPDWNANKINLVIDCLSLSKSGLVINVPKFIEIYENHIAAYSSKLREQHEAAAQGINHFFGSIPVTVEELRRYFVIEKGSLRPNMASINLRDYARLGER